MKKFLLLAVISLGLSSCQQSLEERCAEEAKKYTQKNCPAKIDEFTVMDSMTFDTPTHTLKYYYRLTGTADREVLEQERMRKALLDALKNSTSMKAYKDAGYNFEYSFRSEKAPEVVLFSAKFTEKDY